MTNDKMEKYRLATIEPWHVTEEEFRPEMNELAESIFSLGNEYMGTRGNFEEGFSGEKTLTGCYIGGIYVKEEQAYPWKRKAFPTFSNSMVNTVNWLEIQVSVGGESFSMPGSQISGYRRSLDMRRGVLARELVFETATGRRTALCWERFISHDDPHLGAIRLRVKAVNHSDPITLTFALDGRKENRDFAASRTHTRMVRQAACDGELFLLTNILTTGQYTMHRMRVDTPAAEVSRTWLATDKRVGEIIKFTPAQGVEYVFDKIVSVWTSREAGHPHGLIPKNENRTEVPREQEERVIAFLIEQSRGHLDRCRAGSYEALREAHGARVSHLWDHCDIEIEGDPASQQGIRYCMFQLLGAYCGRDSYLNIGPKGYSGECYNGRTFWDTESYCLPFYLFNNPDSVRHLLEYRYNTLDAARAQALEFGYRGAIFPWTTLDGTEDTPVWEYWMGEIHINAIVGYAVFVHAHVTGDKSYLHAFGIELLIELARFWASRAAFIPYRNGYAINRVMGPNEFGQGVNNDWYTNYMAKWLLEYAVKVIGEMRGEAPAQLDDAFRRTQFDPAEAGHWSEVAAKLILNYDADMDVFVENDIFLSLNPLSREELDRDRDYPIERKWTIEKIHNRQIVKQPDVLLPMFLLRDRFTAHQKRQNYRFYEQRCVHTSSLSPSIHSILACEVGRYNQAYDYYLWSSRLDLDNFNNNTEEGLHISSMSGTWLNIVCGFGGLVYTGPLLEFAPILPPAWKSFQFKFVYRGRTIQVGVEARQVSLKLLAGDEVDVLLYGRQVKLTSTPVVAELSPAFCERPAPKAILFDLDGVIVDTAHLHYLAWKKITDREGIHFDLQIYERLKGVSRRRGIEIIMERATRSYGEEEMLGIMAEKNEQYVESLQSLGEKDILPGILSFLEELGRAGYKTAIVSASRNTPAILKRIGLESRFDAVVTGDHTTHSKPDPEGMLLASKLTGIAPESCVVIEDAAAGLQAAISAGMRCIGIGDKTILHQADYTLPSTRYLDLEKVRSLY